MQMDINDMDFQNEFDVIFSNAALHWVRDHRRLLNNSFRALKNGGSLLWDFAGDEIVPTFLPSSAQRWKVKNTGGILKTSSGPGICCPGRLRRDSRRLRFSSCNISEVNRDRFFANADEMIGRIDQPSIMPFIRALPEEVRGKFRGDVVGAMLERTQRAVRI